MSKTECLMCRTLDSLTGDNVVYRDETWTAASAIPVPGWVLVVLNEHKEGVWSLTEDEGQEFGRLMVVLTKALKDAGQAERVYVMSSGETSPHFHAMLLARGADVPQEFRGATLIDHHADLIDAEETERVLNSLRTLLVPSAG